MGFELIYGSNLQYSNINVFSLFSGFIALLLIVNGNNRILEKILIILVLVMSLSFVFTVFVVGIDFGSLFHFQIFLFTTRQYSNSRWSNWNYCGSV